MFRVVMVGVAIGKEIPEWKWRENLGGGGGCRGLRQHRGDYRSYIAGE